MESGIAESSRNIPNPQKNWFTVKSISLRELVLLRFHDENVWENDASIKNQKFTIVKVLQLICGQGLKIFMMLLICLIGPHLQKNLLFWCVSKALLIINRGFYFIKDCHQFYLAGLYHLLAPTIFQMEFSRG